MGVESAPGLGTEFSIRLPLKEKETLVNQGRILIVDDDPQIRRVLRTTLVLAGLRGGRCALRPGSDRKIP